MLGPCNKQCASIKLNLASRPLLVSPQSKTVLQYPKLSASVPTRPKNPKQPSQSEPQTNSPNVPNQSQTVETCPNSTSVNAHGLSSNSGCSCIPDSELVRGLSFRAFSTSVGSFKSSVSKYEAAALPKIMLNTNLPHNFMLTQAED